ncbi:dehydrogenase [Sphingobium lactosutens]|uniref:dihydrolipoamide acetyltransferase family protein n=1 Tax=Sphingobium lactosutens TaxID=522773 RepID=UPI0015BB5778|nr:dihydrolipoamide acetyltransferase family protein [Sphingobium lactosutens]NWK98746.1 dehydrogenase [Sphingobium lactosutens]
MSKLRAFTMPKWGIEMTEGVVANWEVAEGASFAKGALLTLIETDKITNEVEAEYDAVVCRLIAQPGESYPVGALLAVFGDSAADAAAVDQFVATFGGSGGPSAAPAATETPAAPAPASAIVVPSDNNVISPAAADRARRDGIDVSVVAGSGRNGRITLQDVDQAGRAPSALPSGGPVSIGPITGLDQHFASPLAKRVASRHGVDLGKVTGSGPRGRISKDDVLQHVAPTAAETTAPPPSPPAPAPAPAPAEGVRVVKMSPMRKAIARQLTLSKSTIPHFYLRNSAAIDALMAMREQAKRATGAAPSINDYLVRACALALVRHPDINVQVHGDEIHQFGHADVAVAVATDKGLLTPIVRAADTKSVAAISAEVKALAERTRAGKLAPEEFQGGSFSISNLGMFGIDTFDAIINPPQGAILAVGAGRQSAGAANHALQFSTRIQLSLSCDHRAIDGAVGAKFLAELTALIETPEELTR